MNTLLIYNRMLDLIREEANRLEYEQQELNKYMARELTELQKGFAEKRQLILNDRHKHNDWMLKLTHGLYNLVEEERKDGYRAGYKAATKQATNPDPWNKESIRARSISDAMQKWADHF